MPEDAEHVFFWCPRFNDEKNELEDILGMKLDLESLVNLMMTTEKNWAAVSSFATAVIKKLRTDER